MAFASRVRLTFLLVALMMAISAVNGAMWREQMDPDPDHPNTCIQAENNIQLRVGESAQNPGGECSSMSCHYSETDNKMVLIYTGCGLVAPAEGCNIVQNMQSPHPGCCRRMVCPH